MADEYSSFRLEEASEMRARLTLVKSRLAMHNVTIPPGRLALFERLSDAFAVKTLSPLPAVSREVVELLEGNRDFQEVAAIVEHLFPPEPPADPWVLRQFEHVLSGAPLPSEDRNPRARNTQFELYVAALCRRGGLPVKFDEPDCIVSVKRVRLGIAAKRVGSLSGVRGLFHDGARQLRKAGLIGVVAMSFDRLFRPNDERTFGQSAEALQREAPRILDATVGPHLHALSREAASSPAIAVFAFLVVPIVVRRENRIGRMAASHLHLLRPVTPAEDAALQELHERTAHRSSLAG